MKKEQFNVTGMTCAACSARVEKAVGKLAGVDKVAVNLLKNSMVVDYDDAALNTQGIIDAVVNAGYGASLKNAEAKKTGKAADTGADIAKQEYESIKRRLKLSLIFAVPLSYISMGHMMGWPLPGIFLGVEKAPLKAVADFCRAAVLYLHGAHDGLAAARDFPRLGKRDDFFADAAAFGNSGGVHQF